MPPTVGSQTRRTWNNSPSSQLHGGYVEVCSAAREETHRAARLLLERRCFKPSTLLSFSWKKSVTGVAENGMRQRSLLKSLTDVLGMVLTQIVSCLPKRVSLTDGTCEILDRMVIGRLLIDPPRPQAWPKEISFLLENGTAQKQLFMSTWPFWRYSCTDIWSRAKVSLSHSSRQANHSNVDQTTLFW